jgi:hypothetical protein
VDWEATVNLLNQGQVEAMIMDIVEALDEQTHVYSQIADQAAEAEADWKIRYARAVVSLANNESRMTAAERSARAEVNAANELRRFKTLEASKQATKEHLLSLRARLDALRTLNASIRTATGGH